MVVFKQVGTQVVEVPTLETYEGGGGDTPLGLQGEFQRVNAALAVALCHEWDKHLATSDSPKAAAASERVMQLRAGHLPASYSSGLSSCRFAGRAQILYLESGDLPGEESQGVGGGIGGNAHNDSMAEAAGSGRGESGCTITFFLDGAHTPESSLACATYAPVGESYFNTISKLKILLHV